MKKIIFIISVLAILIPACKSSIEISRNSRVHFKEKLYILPYKRAEKNVGYDDPNESKAFAMVKIEGKHEDLLIKEIMKIFKSKKIFSSVIKVKNKNQVPEGRNNWIFLLDNNYMRVDKIGLKHKAWLESKITITDKNDTAIFNKKYKIHVSETFSEVDQIAFYLYEKLITKLMNDLECRIAGLEPYEKSKTGKNAQKHPGKKGDFWL